MKRMKRMLFSDTSVFHTWFCLNTRFMSGAFFSHQPCRRWKRKKGPKPRSIKFLVYLLTTCFDRFHFWIFFQYFLCFTVWIMWISSFYEWSLLRVFKIICAGGSTLKFKGANHDEPPQCSRNGQDHHNKK